MFYLANSNIKFKFLLKPVMKYKFKNIIKKEMLVTFALPYANENLHIGNMLEIVQADIWVRYQKQKGNKCLLISGDDAHGTPIMISAKKQGIKVEDLLKKVRESRIKDLKKFDIKVDNYHTTHSKDNKEILYDIYGKIKKNGDIEKNEIVQLYDQREKMFLPDRYIKGTCYKCGSKNQSGDNCSSCGIHYSPMQLLNPISTLSGISPVKKKTMHLFFKLSRYKTFLQNWISKKHLQMEVVNKLKEWIKDGSTLKTWNISRDKPYFGFRIPDNREKYFYVWMDAPVGYLSSFMNYCKKNSICYKNYERQKFREIDIYHFIGKDIIYFHAIFWTSILHSAGYNTPKKIFTHGFLKINGKKMSKSDGNFIDTGSYINTFNDVNYIRYYFASKLDDSINDINLDLEDLMQKVNYNLIGKILNILSRASKIINMQFESSLYNISIYNDIYSYFLNKKKIIYYYYENLQYKKVLDEILFLSNKINKLIDGYKPWLMIKNNVNRTKAHLICSLSINLYRIIIFYLSPVVPDLCKRSRELLGINEDNNITIKMPLKNHIIKNHKILLKKILKSQINDIMRKV